MTDDHLTAWHAASEARNLWLTRARPKQLLPPGDAWNILIWRMGRGSGKSQSQSEALWWEMWRYGVPMIGHYLGATLSDVRGTLFEGPAGLLATIPTECLMGGAQATGYNKSMHEIKLSNGSLIRGFATTEQAERLRGPQCHFAAFDELAAWDRPAGNLESAFNNAMYGVRLPYPRYSGGRARVVCGTTPRPIPFLKRLEKRPDVRVITGSSYENLENLSPTYRSQLLSQEGTLMGKQEIRGDYIDEESDLTIWKRAWVRLWPAAKKLPEFVFVLESYDTAMSEEAYDVKRQTTDPSASIVLGVFNVAQVFDEIERRKLGIPRLKFGVMLCDAWSERLGFPDLIDRMREQHKIKWGASKKKADIVLIEDKNSGRSARQVLAGYGVPTWPYNPHGESKTTRAHAVAPMVMQGMLFVPESMRPDRAGMPRDWVEPFLEQICAFSGPGSVEHDDWVDTLSQALLYLKNRDIVEAAPDKPYVDFEEEREAEIKKAEQRMRREKIVERGNPYG